MGLSCLFGHDFADPTHRQKRERHGEEVVLTTRNVETCRRCGTERVLTENTAVMKRDAAHAEGAEAEADDDEPSGETASTAGAGTPTADEASGTSTAPDDVGGGSVGDEPPVTDDAVILTDGSREKRRPMEWPEFETTGTAPGRSKDADADRRSGSAGGGRGSFGEDSTRERSELRCESCDTTWDPTAASLLAGDLCPRCRSGYLTDG